MRRFMVVSALALVFSIVSIPGQAATVRHRLDHSRNAFALWENRDTGTIAIAHILPDDNLQSLILFTQYRDAHGTVIGTKSLSVEQLPIGPYGTFTMSRRLLSARLDVSGVPANCFTSGRAPGCSATPTMNAHLAWTGVGKRMHSTNMIHCKFQGAGFVFIFHILSSTFSRGAVAAGTMNGMHLSTGDIEEAELDSGLSGDLSVEVTNQGQAPSRVGGRNCG